MISLTRREEQVLMAIWSLKDDAYLVSIKRYLEELTMSDWPISAVQKPLLQLEKKGYITTRMGETSAKRGGRRKKMCSITNHGVEALRNLKKEQEILWKDFVKAELKTT